ncbi:major facilitator superfamily domain-containing protein 1-like isoform X4 [Sitodiplosis mosellana]|uniref:major facilitator superfamily domain-containing protein 1-like isoform X4 n=1 Tax=Sitodiplosis mosellana TaxID=263140 RepID=UPI0024441FD8|nr:major facilitator superfamily domain-containing protein 1-like isoform X4 [Sitodiplosis mosellana]
MSGNDDLSTLILDSDEDDEENRQTSNDDELNAGIGFGGSTCHRFIALILMSLIAAAPIFCSPGPLQNYFMKDLDLSTTQYVWLSSINIWPNVVICFLGGFLIDRVFGVRFGTILYSFIMMVGQLIVSIGVMLGAFRMILLGRFILGIGEGSIAVACPLFGYIIDKTGKNIYWMLISILALITAHSLFAFTYVNPLICMILMGLAILMLSFNVTPLIALVVPAYQLGTAFGFVGSAVSLILSVNSMFIGTIVDCGGYFTLEIFCICWSGVALTGTVVFWIYDAIKNGILNMTPHERELRLAVKLADNSSLTI